MRKTYVSNRVLVILIVLMISDVCQLTMMNPEKSSFLRSPSLNQNRDQMISKYVSKNTRSQQEPSQVGTFKSTSKPVNQTKTITVQSQQFVDLKQTGKNAGYLQQNKQAPKQIVSNQQINSKKQVKTTKKQSSKPFVEISKNSNSKNQQKENDKQLDQQTVTNQKTQFNKDLHGGGQQKKVQKLSVQQQVTSKKSQSDNQQNDKQKIHSKEIQQSPVEETKKQSSSMTQPEANILRPREKKQQKGNRQQKKGSINEHQTKEQGQSQIQTSSKHLKQQQQENEPEKSYLSEAMQQKVSQNKNKLVYTRNPSLISALNRHEETKISQYVKQIIENNRKLIDEHNSNKDKSYKLAENKFVIYTQDEFKEMFLTLLIPDSSYVKNQPHDLQVILPDNETPNKRLLQTMDLNVDWRLSRKMTSVKYQKECGACYSFTAIAAIESAYILKGKYLNLAEQELVDCSLPYGNFGCEGGWTTNAYQYIKDFGVVYESDYPYKAKFQDCKADPSKKRYWIKNYVELKDDCNLVGQALKKQPLSIAINAHGLQYYSKGIFTDCQSGPSNHGVILAGADATTWLVKNSWGYSWGEEGYIRISKTAANNACNVCQWASYPVL